MKRTDFLKRFISIFMSVSLIVGAFGGLTANAEGVASPEYNLTSLDGKKVLVIGNSMLYYGNCVNGGNQGNVDGGYLYRLIRAGGEKATIIDHTYSGKNLSYIYENHISKLSKEELESFDYVVMSEWAKESEKFLSDCEDIMSLFGEKTKFYYMCHPMLYEYDLQSILGELDNLRALGVEIVDWGKMVYDIYTGERIIASTDLEYNRETFIKNNIGMINGEGFSSSGKEGDDKHPNPLSGYIAAQMLYSAITHRPAQFFDYSFCGDNTIYDHFDFELFISAHYNGDKTTNFDKVFASASDMLSLQMLIDQYNELEGRHSYLFLKEIKPTCTSSGLSEGVYCAACATELTPQTVIPHLEHKLTFEPAYDATCTTDGNTERIVCTECKEVLQKGKKSPALGHKKEEKLTPSTTKKAGKTEIICTTCKETLKSTKIYRIKSVSLSTEEYTYNGKKRTPAVTVKDWKGQPLEKGKDYKVSYSSGRIKAGTYEVTVTFMGNYSGSTTKSFVINPKSVKLKKLTPRKKGLTISWSKANSSTLSYELEYARNADFENSERILISKAKTVSKKVSGLKSNKTYYARIRTFRIIDGKIYFSDWSKTLSKKTK